MPETVIQNVQTQPIGYAPILKYFFDAARIQAIIDENVALDPRRKILTHGQAAVAMITAILFQVFQLYRICRFADKARVLKVIFPKIASHEYFDDRLADTLDAIYRFGIGNLEMLITQHMIAYFDILYKVCHNDTTTGSVYGKCNNHLTPGGIDITYGFSKKHRQDLKQFVWSLSVSDDAAFPLFQQAYSGNTADVATYVEQWQNLIDLLGERDFLYVGDCKLASIDNMAHIHDNNGLFVAPLPLYSSYEKAFSLAMSEHDREVLIFYKNRFNRGFEVPLPIRHEGKDYPFRMIILFDKGVCDRKQNTLSRHVANTKSQFSELSKKINKFKLKTHEQIEKACRDILKKNDTQAFFEFEITNEPITTHKNKKRGRAPKQGAEQIAVIQDHFRVDLHFNNAQFDTAISKCGYYPLITNKPTEDFSIEDAMLAHKGQYKNEHTNRRAKTSLNLEPIYMHTPERIEAILFLFKIALQITVLIERNARKSIQDRNKGLDDFMPNRKDVRNPTAENLLSEFQDVVQGEIPMQNGQSYGFVSKLTTIQQNILEILGIPLYYYSYEYLFNST
jgi:transposase